MASPSHPRDARLLARARDGDAQAFEQIYLRYAPSLLAFCRHLTGQREDAEDAVQHTFMAAYRRIAASGDRLDLRPWLFTVARNRCLSLLRKRASGKGQPIDGRADAMVDGLTVEVERREELRALIADLARLPEPQRAALLLSQLDALPHREIAQVLGVEPDKVKALVFQARSSLASTREAREAPCVDIRRQIATARGSSLRRRTLRRHVRDCEGCRDYEAAILGQRHDLGLLLPVVPSAALTSSILDVVGRGAGAGSGAGAVATTAGGGGAVGGGLIGSLAGIGGTGVAKLALVGVLAGGAAGGAVAADLPAKLDVATPSSDSLAPERSSRSRGQVVEAHPESPDRALAPDERRTASLETQAREDSAGRPPLATGPGSGAGGGGPGDLGDPGAGQPEDAADLPPGLAKRDELPPGLAKKEELPPGLAKRGATPPGHGKAGKPKPPSGGGQGQGNGNGQGTGNAQGGGQGNAGGQGGGNGGGQGNGNGQGTGNAGGSGNSGGNGNAGGNGQGNGH